MLLRLLGGGSRASAQPSHSSRVFTSSSSAFRHAPPATAAHCCGPALARVALTAALVAATAASSCLPHHFTPVPPAVARCFKTSSSGPDLPAADSTSNRQRPAGAEPIAMADTDTDTTVTPTQQQQQQQQPHTFTQRKAELHTDQQQQQDRSQGRDQDPGAGSAQQQQGQQQQEQAEGQQGAGGEALVQPRSLPSPGMVQLLGHLIDRGVLRSPEVAEAMSQVDRRTFLEVMEGDVEEAYEDHPLPIGYRQTISAPHMHATALELLRNQLKPGARVLDVGSGSGYLTAVMGLMVRPGGVVLGVEVVGPLAGRSVEAIGRASPGLMQEGTVRVMQGNVMEAPHLLQLEPPFDAIHVGAAAARLPQDLVSRLAPGGRMVVPVGPHGGVQALTVVDRDRHVGGGVHVHQVMDVGYVPLVGS